MTPKAPPTAHQKEGRPSQYYTSADNQYQYYQSQPTGSAQPQPTYQMQPHPPPQPFQPPRQPSVVYVQQPAPPPAKDEACCLPCACLTGCCIGLFCWPWAICL
ncbi:hypothetical protein CC2G_004576 [Coprinopsis cinerea AmutBmut pab1-1]|nr:hypothetical protein CC2G_004576 [Coprinopsis cinerea AmutBmut pab1-1]